MAGNCLRVSGADGPMLGRGRAIKPLIFAEIASDLFGCEIAGPTISLPAVYGNYIDLLNGLFQPEYRLGRLKEFTHYFAQNYKFGHHLASKVQTGNSMDEQENGQMFFLKITPIPLTLRVFSAEAPLLP
jgi:tRNA-dihydrouridine synthase